MGAGVAEGAAIAWPPDEDGVEDPWWSDATGDRARDRRRRDPTGAEDAGELGPRSEEDPADPDGGGDPRENPPGKSASCFVPLSFFF